VGAVVPRPVGAVVTRSLALGPATSAACHWPLAGGGSWGTAAIIFHAVHEAPTPAAAICLFCHAAVCHAATHAIVHRRHACAMRAMWRERAGSAMSRHSAARLRLPRQTELLHVRCACRVLPMRTAAFTAAASAFVLYARAAPCQRHARYTEVVVLGNRRPPVGPAMWGEGPNVGRCQATGASGPGSRLTTTNKANVECGCLHCKPPTTEFRLPPPWGRAVWGVHSLGVGEAHRLREVLGTRYTLRFVMAMSGSGLPGFECSLNDGSWEGRCVRRGMSPVGGGQRRFTGHRPQ